MQIRLPVFRGLHNLAGGRLAFGPTGGSTIRGTGETPGSTVTRLPSVVMFV